MTGDSSIVSSFIHNSRQSEHGHCLENMRFNAFILIVCTLVCTLEARRYSISDFAITKNCTEVYEVRTPKYVPYDEVYYTRNWIGLKKRKTRTNYRLETHISHQTRQTCCDGYQSYGAFRCIPVCSRSCSLNGICAAPETCRCNEGYRMDHNTNECKPICLNECINGFCVSPNLCACKEGFRMRPDGFTCEPICYECTNLEYCVEPHVCRCVNGYTRDSVERVDRTNATKCRAVCERECVNADCVEPDLCRCHDGYADFDNDAFTCEPICRYGCTHGTCTAPNTCTCLEGYALRANHSNICDPVCKDECVNAECIAPDMCSCYDGYLPDGPETSHICQPYCNSTCAHGKCTAPDECTCDAGYSWNRDGNSCEPVCTETCVKGSCTAPETCTCHEGYELAQESKFACQPVCREPCVNGYCSAPNECTCNDGYEKKSNTSESSKCVVVCECENGHCEDDSSTCKGCAEGYDLTPSDNSTQICTPHCDGACSGHGQCVEPQKCECDENYSTENDESGNPVVCAHACGGECLHGSCLVDSRVCECPHGWVGKHCEEPTVCAIFVMDDDPVYAMINESRGYDAFENASSIENPWTGPVCSEKCKVTIDNSTLCSEELGESHSNVTCFINIDSSCNSYMVVMSNTYQNQLSMATVVASSVIAILCVAAAVCTGLFIRKRNRDKSLEMTRSAQLIKQDDACLIDNEADSISL